MELGAGRFAKIGFPEPHLLGSFVAGFEIVCGTLILFGLITRIASIPLILIMLIAVISTKLHILNKDGLWKMLHESRTDWAMLLGSIFLLCKGGGKWSVDNMLIYKDTTAKSSIKTE